MAPAAYRGRFERASPTDERLPDQATVLEEYFCDEFAAELLTARVDLDQVGVDLTHAADAATFLRALERHANLLGISVYALLVRLTRLGAIPGDLLIAVVRTQAHYQTRRDSVPRIASIHRSNRQWFIPGNQRAATVRLRGAVALLDWWTVATEPEAGPPHRRRSCVASVQLDATGAPIVSANRNAELALVDEDLRLNARLPLGKWHTLVVATRVLYRLYASTPYDAYCLALIQLPTLTVNAGGEGPSLSVSEATETMKHGGSS
jgi:hypothetical protein